MSREEIVSSMSLQDAIQVFKDTNTYGTMDIAKTVILKALEQEPRWIPVSEMLPEDSELVLFSTKTDEVFEGIYFADNTDRQWYSFRVETFAWNNVVTAWMPLPEPYKAESEV